MFLRLCCLLCLLCIGQASELRIPSVFRRELPDAKGGTSLDKDITDLFRLAGIPMPQPRPRWLRYDYPRRNESGVAIWTHSIAIADNVADTPARAELLQTWLDALGSSSYGALTYLKTYDTEQVGETLFITINNSLPPMVLSLFFRHFDLQRHGPIIIQTTDFDGGYMRISRSERALRQPLTTETLGLLRSPSSTAGSLYQRIERQALHPSLLDQDYAAPGTLIVDQDFRADIPLASGVDCDGVSRSNSGAMLTGHYYQMIHDSGPRQIASAALRMANPRRLSFTVVLQPDALNDPHDLLFSCGNWSRWLLVLPSSKGLKVSFNNNADVFLVPDARPALGRWQVLTVSYDLDAAILRTVLDERVFPDVALPKPGLHLKMQASGVEDSERHWVSQSGGNSDSFRGWLRHLRVRSGLRETADILEEHRAWLRDLGPAAPPVSGPTRARRGEQRDPARSPATSRPSATASETPRGF